MANFLGDALQSIQQNTFKKVEIIIIDDGSADDTFDVVERFKNKSCIPVLYIRISHRGKSAAINRLLKENKLRGEYIAFMDADDVLPAESLQKRYDKIIASGAELVIGEFSVINRKGKLLERRRLASTISKKQLIDQYFFSLQSPFHLNAAIISRQLISDTGLLDERLQRGQEAEYVIRLLQSARSFKILEDIVYRYRRYHRPIDRRVPLRLQTMRCRRIIINKHLGGIQRIRALATHSVLDLLKLGYEALSPKY